MITHVFQIKQMIYPKKKLQCLLETKNVPMLFRNDTNPIPMLPNTYKVVEKFGIESP